MMWDGSLKKKFDTELYSPILGEECNGVGPSYHCSWSPYVPNNVLDACRDVSFHIVVLLWSVQEFNMHVLFS